MKAHRFEKTLRIVNELMLCCYQLGCAEFHLDMDLQPTYALYGIRATLDEIDERELTRISECLNTPRQPEIETNYWGLGGQSDSHSELQLVGMMVDEAVVRHENGELSIQVKRYRKGR